MATLTNSELKNGLESFVSNIPTYLAYQAHFFELLLNTGCRPTELLKIELWAKQNETTYTLNPLKGNNIRLFDKRALPSYWTTAIETQINPLKISTVRQYRFTFNKLFPFAKCSVKGKEIELYLFRHNAFKQLHEQGLTDTEIKTIMGEKTLHIAQNYIYSTINYQP